MRKIAPLVGLLAVLLFLPTPAAAKQISKLSICGPSSCTSITDSALLQEWMQADSGRSAQPAAVAPFFRLETTVTAEAGETFDGGSTSITWSDFYIPSAGVIRGTSESNVAAWTGLGSRAAEILSTAAKEVTPYPAPVVTRATVGRRQATDPASYSTLFDSSWKISSGWASSWTRIRLHSDPASPWTDGKNVLLFSSKRRLLVRDGETVKVLGAVARQLTRAQSLSSRAGNGSALAIGLGVAAAALGGVAWAGHTGRRSCLKGRV
jgi:hypothetical protein